MLKLSKKADYAIVALSHLQAMQKPASAREIATAYNLSIQMLANVLKLLCSTGVLTSKRGVSGGYSLGKDPKTISIGEVIDIIDGPLHFSDCTTFNKACRAEDRCPAKEPMIQIHRQIKNFVDNLSLADVVGKPGLISIS